MKAFEVNSWRSYGKAWAIFTVAALLYYAVMRMVENSFR